MPIHFIDNYPSNGLEQVITKKDGSALEGEIWVYRQFLQFNELNLVPDETWYLKHNYNLSKNPGSEGKVEGQVDFILLSKHGLLVIEVKGGGLRVDGNDVYYSYNSQGEYETQNPFNQAKEYIHSFRNLISSKIFVYRAVVLPHEAGFKLLGPQLEGYDYLFYSKKDFGHLNTSTDFRAINESFFQFISELGIRSRRRVRKELYPNKSLEKINKNLFSTYPELKTKEIKRIKSELFPNQTSYGYNPDKIISEIILNENYETLKGLRRNRCVLVQGAPGTGKTVLATKYLAENLLKQHRGIVFCANKLVRKKLENIITNDYRLDSNSIAFKIFSQQISIDSIGADIDFVIFDEAQEYLDKGLAEFIESLEKKSEEPKLLILFDPNQTVRQDFTDISWYADYFIDLGFTHYLFDSNFRCIQNPTIGDISNTILKKSSTALINQFKHSIVEVTSEESKIKIVQEIVNDSRYTNGEKVILVNSKILFDFNILVNDFFKSELEELTEQNVCIASTKIRYTTPIKYRGLETSSVYLFTDNFESASKTQNYIGATRAMDDLKLIQWK